MIIIGISGRKGAGKDEICRHVQTRFKSSKRIAFADPLKDEVCRAMLVSREYMEKNKDNFRLILQGWGTDYRRKLHGDDYWLRKWLLSVRQLEDVDVVITPDVRFVNEAQLIHNSNGFVWKVERPSLSQEDNHISETELDKWNQFDRTIVNSSTIGRLQIEVDLALEMSGLL